MILYNSYYNMITESIYSFNTNYVTICDAIKNSFVIYNNFYKLLYSNNYLTFNGVFILFKLNYSYIIKDKIFFDINDNYDIIDKINLIEENILNLLFLKKEKQLKLKEFMNNGIIKFSYSDYDNMVVLTLRSRGISDLNTGGPKYDISGDTVVFDCSGTYSKVLEDPFASFGLSAQTNAGNNYTFKVDMTSTSKEYAPRVLGTTPFDKKRDEVPVFVEESYPNLLLDGYRRGKIRGLQCCLTHLPGARHNNTNLTSIGWYMNQWQTPGTPWVVSELQGTDVFRLFKFISISDGSAANREYKVSISNLSFERGEFDILVRDFNDTDARPNVLEKFTRCSLDPTRVSFIGRKVGTSTGEFALNSNYIMVQLGDGVLDGTYTGSLPCGFEGYRFRKYSNCAINPSQVAYDRLLLT